ncbi:MAG TPA: Gfo/Idh/MocA family oxidoreductase, partial [bacterium]|nr:Gfo/Idh/MocA family oxidoreductase [bacterium]
MKKNFALIGAAGYIAPRHMKAIKETGNDLLAMLDPNDSIGIIDSYFPEAEFFVEFERFDRHIDKLRRRENRIDYVSIASPNYLHDAHIRLALRNMSDAICEKPLVLNPWTVDNLKIIEKETGHHVNTILQLRLHPTIAALKKKIDEDPSDKVYDVDLTYITSRGRWYDVSWKGDMSKSGGMATNIGIHFFDMLQWIFGYVQKNIVNVQERDVAAGFMQFEKARVRWFMSINENMLPKQAIEKGKKTFRCITIDGEELEFSEGFTDLHTVSYQKILAGEGFSLEDSRTAVEIAFNIRNASPVGLRGDY